MDFFIFFTDRLLSIFLFQPENNEMPSSFILKVTGKGGIDDSAPRRTQNR